MAIEDRNTVFGVRHGELPVAAPYQAIKLYSRMRLGRASTPARDHPIGTAPRDRSHHGELSPPFSVPQKKKANPAITIGGNIATITWLQALSSRCSWLARLLTIP